MEREKGLTCSKPLNKWWVKKDNGTEEVHFLRTCVHQTENGQCEDEDAWQDCQEGGQKRKKQKYLFQDFLDKPMPSETKSSGQ